MPRGGLVVSCQARPDNPLHGPAFMAAMARAAAEAGAVAIRANGAADIAAIRAAVGLPIIGIAKRATPGFDVEITPALADAAAILSAGATAIALDATGRRRDGEPLPALIAAIRARWSSPIMADVATPAEGERAAALGCDLVATTLSGYTADSPRIAGPDFDLVARLAARVDVPIVAEGRFTTPAEVARALAVGAHAVVIGTAITNPREIARRFVAAGRSA
ncbi:MAG: putative N-acetylmannosamine-6-phosphate 2-epimerase [Alphaproteobacteria bacterium]|nr:putative N-acetylmannosamine-6-phosphate 2-epimerase [Alphaproteobacteria bacterium]